LVVHQTNYKREEKILSFFCVLFVRTIEFYTFAKP